MTMKRREFLQSTAGCAAAAAAVMAVPGLAAGAGKHKPVPAKYWKALENKEIECRLCPHECRVDEGSRGMCGVRENMDGKYYTLVHSRPVALHNDPIEKKPFFHFIPGTKSYSMATAGCNFSCKFCQNWEISQFKPEEVPSMFLSPQDVVETALKKGSKSISFTYNEPTIFYEYMFDTAKIAKEKGLQTGVISNGFIQKKPLEALLDYIDAYRVDFKSFKEKFYTDMSSGHLKPVLKTMKRIKKKGKWLELIHLMIPTLNDSAEETRAMSRWIKQELGPDVPLHLTRFHPMYKMTNLPKTPVKTLEKAREIALESGLHFVYLGNVIGHKGEHTYCPYSGEVLIKRIGYKIIENKIKDGKCPCCNKTIAGKWE